MPSADSIWQDLQRSFKEELNPASYSAWIETANVLSFEKSAADRSTQRSS